MLDANNDRLDYGHTLAPPEGFVIDAAVATTYSLDLNALLAVPIALCFNNTLEGNLKGEKLALLEAMSQLKGKLKVFYQEGNIHFPEKFNRLYTLLEPCLQGITPSGGAFSSFHPKLWLLRFVEAGGVKQPKIQYRLLVLSRNLTFDRSWDIALCLDGVIDKRNANGGGKSFLLLFETLLDQSSDFLPAKTLLKELPKIAWDVPKPFDWLELRVGGPEYGAPIEPAESELSDLLVVSPFVKSQGGGIDGLLKLAGDDSAHINKTLCSRAEELNAIYTADNTALEGWDCFAINSAIVDGEENLALNESNTDVIQQQNLHAKLIVRAHGNYCDWLLGSANATSAGLGDDKNPPRNTEVMVQLGGRKKVMRPQTLVKEWLGQGLFVPHVFEALEVDDSESLVTALRQLIHLVVNAKWLLKASLHTDDQGYDVVLEHDLLLSKIPKGAAVTVSQLDLPGCYDLKNSSNITLLWQEAGLNQLSAFIVLDVKVTRGKLNKSTRCLIKAELEIEGGDLRQQNILKSLVDSPSKILNYVRLLLHKEPDKSQWLEFDAESGEGQHAISSLLSMDEPLFEQLMIASARHPEVINRIEKLMISLRESGVVIPHELNKMWPHFSESISKSKKRNSRGYK